MRMKLQRTQQCRDSRNVPSKYRHIIISPTQSKTVAPSETISQMQQGYWQETAEKKDSYPSQASVG